MLALSATPAAASQLVYGCGSAFETLCRARPDGSGQRPIFTDGGYSGAGLSRSGRLAWVKDGAVHTRAIEGGAVTSSTIPFIPALVRFRPDGARYVVAEGASVGGTQLCSYNTDLSGTNNGRYCLATGVSSGMDYMPDGRIIMAHRGGSAEDGRAVISLLRPEDGMGTGVDRRLVRDPTANLESPSLSPDGRLVALVRAPLTGGVRGDIALYDTTTGALVRVLTSGGADGAPAFSPDGKQVAFDRGEAIWVVSVNGGTPKRIVSRGRSVAWGGGDVPLAYSRLKLSARNGKLSGSVRVAVAGSKVVVSSGGRKVTRTGSGTVRFTLRVRGSRPKVTVAVTPPGGSADRTTKTVRAK